MLADRAPLGAMESPQHHGGTHGGLQALRAGDGRVRAQSTKARKNGVTRKRLQWELLVERGAGCQACHLTPVGNRRDPRPWSDMHEILTRARGGDPTDGANILCLCRECHKWVTEHETDARELGLVRARTAEEHNAVMRPWLTQPRI